MTGVWLLMAMLCCAAAQSDEDLPLPRWSEDELRLFQEQRQIGLEPDTLLPEAPGYLENLDQALREPLTRGGPRLDELPSTLSGEIIPRFRVQDILSFLPDASREEVRRPSPASADMLPLRETTREFLQAAIQWPGDRYLIDPEARLPEMATMEIERLLEFHASDARIKLYVLVLAKNEKLPPDAGLDSIASGKLVSSDACLIVYPLAEPWRARLLVSRTVHDMASPMFLSETAGECVRQALIATEAGDQLERFITALSPRLFWLQNAMGKASPAPQPSSVLQEVAEVERSTPPPVTEQPQGESTAILILRTLIAATTLAGLVMGGIWTARRRLRRRRIQMQTNVWLLPEREVQPRLGGAFCGGAGLVARYH
jgi:hypothetical protein